MGGRWGGRSESQKIGINKGIKKTQKRKENEKVIKVLDRERERKGGEEEKRKRKRKDVHLALTHLSAEDHLLDFPHELQLSVGFHADEHLPQDDGEAVDIDFLSVRAAGQDLWGQPRGIIHHSLLQLRR